MFEHITKDGELDFKPATELQTAFLRRPCFQVSDI